MSVSEDSSSDSPSSDGLEDVSFHEGSRREKSKSSRRRHKSKKRSTKPGFKLGGRNAPWTALAMLVAVLGLLAYARRAGEDGAQSIWQAPGAPP